MTRSPSKLSGMANFTPSRRLYYISRANASSTLTDTDRFRSTSGFDKTTISAKPTVTLARDSSVGYKLLMPHPPSGLYQTAVLKTSSNFNPEKTKALRSLEESMQKIHSKLQKPSNYKRFFWTPDMAVCGFGTPDEIQETMFILQTENEK
jgi:hypothetical protein